MPAPVPLAPVADILAPDAATQYLVAAVHLVAKGMTAVDPAGSAAADAAALVAAGLQYSWPDSEDSQPIYVPRLCIHCSILETLGPGSYCILAVTATGVVAADRHPNLDSEEVVPGS